MILCRLFLMPTYFLVLTLVYVEYVGKV